MASGSVEKAQWSLIGSAGGSAAVALPAAFSELIVEARYGTSAVHFIFSLCKAQLDSSAKLFTTGYANGAQTTGFCQVSASDANVYMLALYINGTNYTAASSIRVFGR